MEDLNKSQQAQEPTEAAASTEPAAASLDHEALYHQEVKNSKKQRAAKQELAARVEKLEAELTSKNEAELMQQGKHEEIIAKQKAQIAELTKISDAYNALESSRREALLSEYTDEEREKLKDLPNDALELLNSKTKAKPLDIEHPKSVAANAAGRVPSQKMTLEELNKMDPKERAANWPAYQNQFLKK